MPLPFLLAGLGIAAGIIGAGGHLDAEETNEKAQRKSEEAQELYKSAKYSLEEARNRTEKSLLKLGYAKKKILDCSMKQFLNSYDKIKHISISKSIGLNEISNFSIAPQDAIQLREMSDIYSSSIQSGVAGVATGAIVALGASGSLTLVTGELAVAGSFLAAGEIGAAAGIAGSALSFGATMTPLAAVAAPVVLFTGISASLKADENLEKAQVMYAEAEKAREEMKISETLCDAISDKSEMFNDLLVELDDMFSECTCLLAGVVRKKAGKIKKNLMSADFTESELKLIAVTRALAGAIKAVIDTPILTKDGDISNESQDIYEKITYQLQDFNNMVNNVRVNSTTYSQTTYGDINEFIQNNQKMLETAKIANSLIMMGIKMANRALNTDLMQDIDNQLAKAAASAVITGRKEAAVVSLAADAIRKISE